MNSLISNCPAYVLVCNKHRIGRKNSSRQFQFLFDNKFEFHLIRFYFENNKKRFCTKIVKSFQATSIPARGTSSSSSSFSFGSVDFCPCRVRSGNEGSLEPILLLLPVLLDHPVGQLLDSLHRLPRIPAQKGLFKDSYLSCQCFHTMIHHVYQIVIDYSGLH